MDGLIEMVIRVCLICGKEFEPTRVKRGPMKGRVTRQMYCSKECARKAQLLNAKQHNKIKDGDYEYYLDMADDYKWKKLN